MQLRSPSLSFAALTLCLLVACGPARGPLDGGSGGGTGGGSAGGGSGGGGGTGGAGGGSTVTCAQSCNGCCDSAGACQNGTTATACGGGGSLCNSCASPATCVGQVCKDTSCATCTKTGTCQTALNDTTCGNGGISCLDCAASGGATCNLDAGVCTGGTCAGGCRASSGACAPGNTKGACGTTGGACTACTGTFVCTNGACVAGPSTDGGSTFVYDGGTTISAIKGAPFCSEKVTLKNVVITSIANQFQGSQGDYQAQFWVAEPGNLKAAIYVDKFYTDPSIPPKVELKVGNVVDIEGFTFRQSQFTDRIAYRLTLKSQFNCRKPDNTFYNPSLPVTITILDAGTVPAAPMAPAGFGDAMMGNGRPNPDFASTRVFVPGPLKITNHSPPAFKRLSADTTDNTYFGFEVTGGILVNNFNTFDRFQSDGGLQVRCDYRKMVLDGGSVVFPNGITAAYDTYSHAPCEDGGTSCEATARRIRGVVPGTTNDYTYVLYPADCTELVGQYDAGP